MKNVKVRIFFSWLFYIVGIVGGLYVGCWSMFIKPIMDACQHFDAGTLTGMIVGATILKCLFASPVGVLIAYSGMIIGNVLEDTNW